MRFSMQSRSPKLDQDDFGPKCGLLSRQKIELMVRRGMILHQEELEGSQFQPASLDLRLGPRAYRVRASFLPGKERGVKDQLRTLIENDAGISLEGAGAVLERGCVYVIPLLEHLRLPDSISAPSEPQELNRPPRYFHPPHH